ncbi:MAG: hypothetical protein IPN69_07925 [Acidobacteria bacterium]|nr:hypothetical protein [Acidobacteriota bacterium]
MGFGIWGIVIWDLGLGRGFGFVPFSFEFRLQATERWELFPNDLGKSSSVDHLSDPEPQCQVIGVLVQQLQRTFVAEVYIAMLNHTIWSRSRLVGPAILTTIATTILLYLRRGSECRGFFVRRSREAG